MVEMDVVEWVIVRRMQSLLLSRTVTSITEFSCLLCLHANCSKVVLSKDPR